MADDKILTESEIREYMLGRKHAMVPENPNTTPSDQLLISATIGNDVDEKFGKKVLAPKMYNLVYVMKKSINFVFAAWGKAGKENFMKHPRYADASIYRMSLNGCDKFISLYPGSEELARQIVIAYSLFSDTIAYSYYEDALWEASLDRLKYFASSVGFPVGEVLQAIKRKEKFTEPVMRPDIIRALLSVEGIKHSMSPEHTSAEKFLLDHRDKKYSVQWSKLID